MFVVVHRRLAFDPIAFLLVVCAAFLPCVFDFWRKSCGMWLLLLPLRLSDWVGARGDSLVWLLPIHGTVVEQAHCGSVGAKEEPHDTAICSIVTATSSWSPTVYCIGLKKKEKGIENVNYLAR